MQAGTIVASNYLAMAQVLGESFLEHHPDSTFTVLVVDDEPVDLPDALRVVRLSDLDLAFDDQALMRTVYDVMEFSTAVKPSLLRLLVASGDGAACYLDPDIRVYANFDEHVDAALDHGIVLTPHVLEPVPRDGAKVDEETIMQSGMYNCGFLAVGPSALPFLDWWDERLRFDALVDFARARFTDQRWVDWVPSLFDHTIDRDPGMNVAWWNVHDRPVDTGHDAGPRVCGVPLLFAHFSGYDPSVPGLLSKHQVPRPRIDHALGTGMRALADAYGARLMELGHLARRREPYAWATSHDGVELTLDVRRLVRDAAVAQIERFGSVRDVPHAFDTDLDFSGWVDARSGSSVPRSTGVARSMSAVVAKAYGADDEGRGPIDVERIVPDTRTATTSDVADLVDGGPVAYDVVFDWDDAHGHAVNLLLERSERGVVIDLGCGYAPHAEVLAGSGFRYVGLDVDQTSIDRLRERGFTGHLVDLSDHEGIAGVLDEVLAGADGDGDPLAAVMALDVLEHLVRPDLLLAELSRWMGDVDRDDRSVLVTSVPNVAHRDLSAKLLAGRWDVTPTGLLDHTHLRFFTDSSLSAMMASSGFDEARRNDRIAPRSDQRWPAGLPPISPRTPLGELVAGIRDLGDPYGDTFQMIRAYRPTSGSLPAEVVSAVASMAVAVDRRELDDAPMLSVIPLRASGGAGGDRVEELTERLRRQSCDDWELLVASTDVSESGVLDALVRSARGHYVAFVGADDVVDTRWVEQFRDAATTTVPGGVVDGDLDGRILVCGTEPPAVSAAAAFAFPNAALQAHAALRLSADAPDPVASSRAWLAPICGERATGVVAVETVERDHARRTIDDVDNAAVTVLRDVAEMPVHVAGLAAEVERLRRHNDELVGHVRALERDNDWLNSELSPAPIRVVRRLLRRSAAADDQSDG